MLCLKILRRKRFVVFWDFGETGQFPSQTTISGSRLGGGEINIVDLCITGFDAVFDFNLKWRDLLTAQLCCIPPRLPVSIRLARCITSFRVRYKHSCQSASQVEKVSGFHAYIRIFTGCRRSLQKLKPRSSNWSSGSMHCRYQQQMPLRQLITESTFCSLPRRMQHKQQ